MENRVVEMLKDKAKQIRRDILIMLTEAGSGHPAGSLGMADVFTALYFNIMNHNPKKPEDPNRDRLILSCGHICPAQYAAMANAGYFPRKELMTLRKINSRLQGHPHRHSIPGIENSSGPLGQGLSVAAGIAKALKMDKNKARVYCITSDGENEEGQAWESYLFAAKNKLDNITYILDRNHIQIDGTTDDVMPSLEPMKEKYEAFNLNVIEIDGNDMEQILNALEKSEKAEGKPTMIIAHTIPGKGVSFFENDYKWHGKTPDKELAEKALKELGA